MRTYATQRSRSLSRAFLRWSERGPDGWGNTKTQLRRISPKQDSEDMTDEPAGSRVEVDFSPLLPRKIHSLRLQGVYQHGYSTQKCQHRLWDVKPKYASSLDRSD